jgi:hypothetical protein
MHQEDFWFRFRRSFHELFYGERASVRVFSRLVLLTFIAGFVATVGPTVADVLTPEEPGPVSTYVEPTPEPTSEATSEPTPEASDSAPGSAEPTPEASATGSAEPTPEASPSATGSAEPTADYSVSPKKSDTPTVMPTIEADRALNPQPKYLLKVPRSIAIDPRANSYFLPSIYISGARYTLACINGNGVNFDLSNKRISNNSFDTRTVMVAGDGTSNLLISGQTEGVLSVINAGGGLFAFTNSGGLRDRSASISLTATNKNTIDPTFCSAAAPANTAIFTFRALGLQVDTKKGSGKLK